VIRSQAAWRIQSGPRDHGRRGGVARKSRSTSWALARRVRRTLSPPASRPACDPSGSVGVPPAEAWSMLVFTAITPARPS